MAAYRSRIGGLGWEGTQGERDGKEGATLTNTQRKLKQNFQPDQNENGLFGGEDGVCNAQLIRIY